MRKIIFTIVAVLLSVAVSADERSQDVLRRLSEYIKAQGAYEAEFSVVAGDYRAQGHYEVAGDAYHIEVGQAEVYSDGQVRYEVDHERQEVNIDVMDLSSHNILDNPTRCFDFVGADYSSLIYGELGAEQTLLLRANDPAIEGDIYLTVDKGSARPRKIVYVLYEDRIEVNITSLKQHKGGVKKYNGSTHKGYEIVDFR